MRSTLSLAALALGVASLARGQSAAASSSSAAASVSSVAAASSSVAAAASSSAAAIESSSLPAEASGSAAALPSGSAAPSAPASPSTSSAPATSGNVTVATGGIIPPGLSSTCSAYLATLNANAELASCVSPLLAATNAAVSVTSSPPALALSLQNLCNAKKCDDAKIRTQLAAFYTACPAELADVASVRVLYDLLYVVQPLHDVVCTKDAKGEYCVTSLSANVTSSSLGNTTVKASNTTSGSSSSSFTPDSALHYKTTNLPYLFIQNDAESGVMCSPCAKAVFTAYATWETSTPYALGLSSSPILGGQADLWKGAQLTCGTPWVSVIQKEAMGALNVNSDGTGAGGSSSTSGAVAGGSRPSVGGLALSVALVAAGWAAVGWA